MSEAIGEKIPAFSDLLQHVLLVNTEDGGGNHYYVVRGFDLDSEIILAEAVTYQSGKFGYLMHRYDTYLSSEHITRFTDYGVFPDYAPPNAAPEQEDASGVQLGWT